jgi:thiosulfate/3-mercaptopyruvate sulfurtransferase
MHNKQQISSISTEELLDNIDNSSFKIIDVRSVDAYNGWKFNNEQRGGHIKNARSVPFKWLHYIDWIEIIHGKGILPKHSIVIYGYTRDEIDKVAHQFIKAGYQQVQAYYHFIDEWSANTKFPMNKLQRYKYLVSSDWLYTLINTNTAPEYTNSKYIICHAHYQNKKDYEKGHIPQAIALDTNLLESTKTWNRRSPNELKTNLEQLGITYDTTVVLYGRFSSPNNNDPFPGSNAGHLGAMRCAFIMIYAGVQDVRILNGGLQSWIDTGYTTTTQEYNPHPVKAFGVSIPSHSELVINLQETKEILRAQDKNLVSIRSWREFIGEVSGYHYIQTKGRIPGAVFGNCGSNAYHMENYRNLDHTTREYHEIEQMWEKVGITSDKHNAFYCGTGWRGSEAFFNAWLMGWPNIAVFDGGWFEWSNNGYTYETGIPKK